MSAATLNASQNLKLTSGLVGLWSFNGKDVSTTTVFDRSGNGNDGALTNVASPFNFFTAGKVGQAGKFDGVNDFVNMGTGSSLDLGSGNFTMAVWFKISTPGAYQAILGKEGQSYPYAGYDMRITSENKLQGVATDCGTGGCGFGSSRLPVTGSKNVTDGAWHFGVFVRSGSNMTLYVDGVVDATSTQGPWDLDNSGFFAVGQQSEGGTPFPGLIDDVRIYNRALSPAEVTALYSLGGGKANVSTPNIAAGAGLSTPLTLSGVVGSWNFDEGFGLSATDGSGNGNAGTLTNGPVWNTGKRLNGLSFDGTDDYVDAGSANAVNFTTGDFTISEWFKTTKANQYLVTRLDPDETDGGYSLSVADGKLSFLLENAYPNYYLRTTDTTYNDGQWHYVVATRSGSSAKIYVDGVEPTYTESSDGMGAVDISTNLSTLKFGAFQGFGDFGYAFQGSMDEIKIYDRALDSGEILGLYNSYTTSSSLVGYWSFNGKDVNSTTVFDRSGNGNDGVLTNVSSSTAFFKPGKIGQGGNFDGSNDWVNMGDVLNDTFVGENKQFTVSAWVKPGSDSMTNKFILGKYHAGSDQGREFGLRLLTDGKVEFLWWSDANGGGVYRGHLGTTPITNTKKWYHILATYDGTQSVDSRVKVYVDGMDDSATIDNTNGSATFIGDTSTYGASTLDASFQIGDGDDAGSYAFNGLIDEVRVYSRVLSSTEVKALYTSGGGIANASQNNKNTNGLLGLWSFDGKDVSSSTLKVYDRSGNGNDGDLTNITPFAFFKPGKIGQAGSFDGVNESITLPAASYANLTSGTISMWVYPNDTSRGALISMSDASAAFTVGAIEWGDAGVGKFNWYFYNVNFPQEQWYSNNTFQEKKWHHVVLTHIGSTDEFYVDGVLQTSLTDVVGFGNHSRFFSDITSADTFRIGSRRVNNSDELSFNGKIDEVRVYDRALSHTEITALYSMGK